MSHCGVRADLDAERLANQPLEGGGVSRRRPQLQLGVAGRPELKQRVLAAIVQLEPGDGLRVTAVEAFGQAQDRGQRTNGPPPLALRIRRSRCGAGAGAAWR